MAFFHVELTLRYTRISCMPYRAKLDIDRVLRAADAEDALRQAGLCLDRDLEDIFADINTINVSNVLIDVRTVRELDHAGDTDGPELWNPTPFDPELRVPRYIIVRDEGISAQ